jgi:hypothetical protein
MHERLLFFVRRLGEFDTQAARVAGVFGVRYVIASPRRGVSAPELTLVARGVRDLYRNEMAMPRAYLVPDSRVAIDEFSALRIVKRADFDPRRVVVIEAEAPPMPVGPLGLALATIVDEEPDRVVIRSASTRAAWLVLNDTFAPGWTASVDGLPATILRANGLVRTIAVDAGFHRVEFHYDPASVRWGAWITGAALVMVGLLVSRGSPAGTGGAIVT